MLLNNIWVINMDKSKDRLDKINKNFKSLGLSFNRFTAIDGKTLSSEQLDKISTKACRNILCNRGIIGCAESHKTLWKQLLNDKNTDYYLVLEDDVELSNKSVDIIKKLEPKISEYSIDYLNLYCVNIGCGIIKTKFKIDDFEFGKPRFPLTTTGYIITKTGAKKLLEQLGKTDYHIDFEIALNQLKNNFNYYTSNESIVDVSSEETTIGSNTKGITINLLNNAGLDYYTWLIEVPIFTIKMVYVINIWLIILIIMLIINQKKINSDILLWFIILELFVLHLGYF